MEHNKLIGHKLQEQQIINQCIDMLGKYFKVRSLHARNRLLHDDGIDGEVIIDGEGGQRKLLIQAKMHLSPVSIKHLQNQLAFLNVDRKDLLVCIKYANPNIINQLEEAGINFIDTFGNMGIELDRPMTIVHIKGNKGAENAAIKRGRLTQPSGLKMLFTLLTKSDYINLPYRDIASLSGVSLGSVGWIMRELKGKGYVLEKRNGKLELADRAELFRRWVEAYAEQLRPKITLRTLVSPRFDTEDLLRGVDKVATSYQLTWALTGKVAADTFTHHLIPNKLVFFAKDWTPKFERELGWAPSERGNIVVLDMFAPSVLYQNEPVNYPYPLAHPALVYAELLYEGTDRERETAAILAKDYLSELVAKG